MVITWYCTLNVCSFRPYWDSMILQISRQIRQTIIIYSSFGTWRKERGYRVTFLKINFDPLGPPTVTAGRDHCFCICRPSVRIFVPTFQNPAKQNKAKTMFATGETVGLAQWIINDTCLVKVIIEWYLMKNFNPPLV